MVIIDKAPVYAERILVGVIIWSLFAYGVAAAVDSQNSERTSLERKYIRAWEQFHKNVIDARQSNNIITEDAPEGYLLLSSDFGFLTINPANQERMRRESNRLKESQEFIISQMPSRDEFMNNTAPRMALFKFWAIDISLPCVLAAMALVLSLL